MELYFIKHILSSLLDFDTVHTVKPCLKGKAYALSNYQACKLNEQY
jgi:hypothetical protein